MWWTVSLWLVLASTLSVHTALSDDCKHPAETGPCRARILKYYYDAQNQTCKTFNYGGCQGNRNRFSTQQECLSACRSNETKTTENPGNALTTVNDALCMGRKMTDLINKVRAIIGLGPLQTTWGCEEEKETVCLHPPDTGPCRAKISRFYYNAYTETCESFVYGGCFGNVNRFNTRQECASKCAGVFVPKPNKTSCSLPPKTGPCRARFPKFYFNPANGLCEEFIYGGCQGNDNRFDTQQKCQERCQYPPSPTVSTNICILPREPGLCRAFIPQYFYNSTSQMCEGFIYGGCGGNDNRFDSQAECRGRCGESPVKKEKCRLPPESGPCYARFTRYFHNVSTGMCEEFIFGGCQGNDNRFITEQECRSSCMDSSPTTSKLSCLLPPETGPCRGNFPSYFYNATSGTCHTFVYGGCSGNDNRFDTESQCLQKCQGPVPARPRDLPEVCRLPAETGMCSGYFEVFHFNVTSEKCEQFVYGGCGGNDNNFDTEQDCRRKCDVNASPLSGQVCLLPRETGPCRGAIPRFFYNSSTGSCEEFVYGGCHGNDNRFDTESQCLQKCQGTVPTIPVNVPDICRLPAKTGPCRANFPSYFYNATSRTCDTFVYGGCSGNDNRFDTESQCLQKCQGPVPARPRDLPEVCRLPAKAGMCRGYFEVFHFNVTSGKCEQFVYGGCGGNDNRFDTQQKCQERCQYPPSPTVSTNICILPREPGLCRAFIPQYFYNSTSQMCEGFIYGGCGGNDNRFDSQAECQGRCGESPVKKEKCRLPPESGPCYARFTRYFHNVSTGMCEEFIFGGCQGNDNRFITEQECRSSCMDSSPTTPKLSCLLPPETGPCRGNFPSYFYNATSGTCHTFVYGGCSGNDNRFDTESQCLQKCQGPVPARPRDLPEVCRLPAETGMCRGYFEVFHFNVTSGKCEQFVYGGCGGNDNNFDTEQDCRRKCDVNASPLSGQVCLLPRETGPCRGAIPRFFYNSSTGSCEEFVYGGCHGNDNRFDTQFECEEICGGTLPAPQPVVSSPACLLPPETGPCRARFTKFYFNSTTESCEQFVYGGCQGNENRFESLRDCQEGCRDTSPPGASIS